MLCRCAPFLALLLIAVPAIAQQAPPDRAALAEVQRLGHLLFAYDRSAVVATAAMAELFEGDIELNETDLQAYVAVPRTTGWSVGFGRLADDGEAFLLSAEVTLDRYLNVANVEVLPEARVTRSAYLDGALAIMAAIERYDFEDRPYNFSVIPVGNGDLYVYFMPAQTQPGYFPLGGDTRFRFNPNTREITDEVRLHSGFQQLASEIDGELVEGTLSVELKRTIPAETAVRLAMSRYPQIPHYVVAGEWVFAISPRGTIDVVPAAEFGGTDVP